MVMPRKRLQLAMVHDVVLERPRALGCHKKTFEFFPVDKKEMELQRASKEDTGGCYLWPVYWVIPLLKDVSQEK
ncbi:hypothetical protein V6N13_028573 [Hibiscus sabdariffa]|uniref:Uncharacterized protein n=2 Tax=Hibiscus sabdariffa TaxID=183260 RepID=A0ABR2P9M0_9ROSI